MTFLASITRMPFPALALIAACILFQFAPHAHAQCSTRDASQNGYLVTEVPPKGGQFLATARVWKTVKLGTFADKVALRAALDAANCVISESAAQMIASTDFVLSGAQKDVDLVALSVAELGIRSTSAPLQEIYARAQKLGFGLARAEVGPQFRLQYSYQPFAEFDNIAMAPIGQQGRSNIFVVANGGAGLILLSQDAGPTARFLPISRFVFVRGGRFRVTSDKLDGKGVQINVEDPE